jgi:aminopeptidase N
LTPFFEDWVFNGGFPHYEIDSVWYAPLPNGNQKVEIRINQKLVGAPNYHTNTPLQFSFYDGRQKIAEKTAYVSGSLSVVSFELPAIIPAEDILLNENHLLNQARYDFAGIARANGVANTGNTQIANFNITNIADSAYLFVQYHPVAPTPDAGFSPYRLSDTRFWTIQGNWNPNFRATMRFDVNSSTDAALLASGTDSILVLYRATPNTNWSEHPNYTKRVVGGYVFFTINTVLKGDYTFANGDMGLGVDRNERTRLKSSRIFPNPTQNEVQIELNLRRKARLNLSLIDKLGQVLQTRKIELSSGKNLEQMQLGDLPAGTYFIKIQDMEGDSWDTHTIIKQ